MLSRGRREEEVGRFACSCLVVFVVLTQLCFVPFRRRRSIAEIREVCCEAAASQ